MNDGVIDLTDPEVVRESETKSAKRKRNVETSIEEPGLKQLRDEARIRWEQGKRGVHDACGASTSTTCSVPPNLEHALCADGATPVGTAPLAAFQLQRVRGIGGESNRTIFGANLKDLVCGDMRMAFVSNFMIDMPWLISAFPDLVKAALLIVAHGQASEAEPEMQRALLEAGCISFVIAKPHVLPYGTHHSKFFVVEYEYGVRVIVHTANLIHCDMNNKTQAIWYQDFPLKDALSPSTSEFQQGMEDYARALRLPHSGIHALLDVLRRTDFDAARAHLVCSRPGSHLGSELRKYGHMAVRRHLQQEVLPVMFHKAPLIAQSSSLGSFTEAWLREFVESFASGRVAADNSGISTQTYLQRAPIRLQIVWPTEQEVRESLEGWSAGRSIPGPTKNLVKPHVGRNLHRFDGGTAGRQRAMPHMKSYTRYQGEHLAWTLIGSHNLSGAAWGVLQGGGTKLFIRSFEVAVLVTPYTEQRYQQSRHVGFGAWPHRPAVGASPSAAAKTVRLRAVGPFDGPQPLLDTESEDYVLSVPLPYPLPPHRYGGEDLPWTIDSEHSGQDACGRLWGEFESMYGQSEVPG